MGKDGRFGVAVTFDERRGYVGHPELRAPVTALSLGGLRRKVEAAMLPEEVIVMDRGSSRMLMKRYSVKGKSVRLVAIATAHIDRPKFSEFGNEIYFGRGPLGAVGSTEICRRLP
jgi:hypothetical protein